MKNRFRDSLEKGSISAILLLLLGFGTVLFIFGVVWKFIIPGVDIVIKYAVFELFFAVLLIILVSKLHWWKKAGIKPRNNLRGLFLSWPVLLPLLFCIIMMTVILKTGYSDFMVMLSPFVRGHSGIEIALITFSALAIGFNEELLFRGIIFESLRIKGRVWTYLLSSLIFGLVHLGGILRYPEVDGLHFIMTAINAFCLGMLFAGIRWHTNSLFMPMLIHTLYNYPLLLIRGFEPPAGDLHISFSDNYIELAFMALIFLWGLRMMFRKDGTIDS